MLILLAHGALGPYDEIIFLGVAVIFVVMMAVSWVRSRNTPPPVDDDPPVISPEDDRRNHVSLE